jgi:hypothetical protein
MLTILAAAVVVAIACQQEPVPPPQPLQAPIPTPQAALPQAPPSAAVPAAPTVVYASAEPAHGGTTQKVGDYMVELATGPEGKVDFYVQKYEGAVQSFDNVQLEVDALSKTETTEDGEPASQNVVFYPKDGKLEGTVAGMEKGAYDFNVKVYEIESETTAEGTFQNVEVDPLKTSVEAKHDGTVYVVENAKMELVQDGDKLKVYLRDLADNDLDANGNQLEDVTVSVGDGEEKVDLDPAGDHFEGKLSREVPEEEEVKVIWAKLIIGKRSYDKLRIARVVKRIHVSKKKPKTPELLTITDAKKKIERPKPMKGTVGSMKVGAPPASATGKKSKTSKGPATKGKKAGKSSPSGKKSKTSKGPSTKGKKAK